jgi:Na+/H+-dicarboxylate symporter
MNDGGNTVVDMSLSDTIYEGVFLTLIPENIFQEFYNANYAAIIVFAIAMGVACAKVLNRQQIHSSDMTFMSLLVDLDQILTIMIIWIIMLTPFGKLQLLLYYYDALSYIYIYIYIYTI